MIGIRLKEADSEASPCRDINFYRKKHRCFKSSATLTYAEYAEYVNYAKYAKYAKHAEYAKYAKYAEYADWFKQSTPGSWCLWQYLVQHLI